MQKNKYIDKIIEKFLNLIFPPVCGFCGKINNEFLCDKCKQKLQSEKLSHIDDYKNQPVFFDEHYYLFKYQKDIRDYILKYKFDEKSYLYKSFSELFIRDEVFTKSFIDDDCQAIDNQSNIFKRTIFSRQNSWSGKRRNIRRFKSN